MFSPFLFILFYLFWWKGYYASGPDPYLIAVLHRLHPSDFADIFPDFHMQEEERNWAIAVFVWEGNCVR